MSLPGNVMTKLGRPLGLCYPKPFDYWMCLNKNLWMPNQCSYSSPTTKCGKWNVHCISVQTFSFLSQVFYFTQSHMASRTTDQRDVAKNLLQSHHQPCNVQALYQILYIFMEVVFPGELNRRRWWSVDSGLFHPTIPLRSVVTAVNCWLHRKAVSGQD